MRVTCPHCSKEVTLPNEKAEQAVACPSCHNIFTAPALMNALPDLPSPPPPPPPPAAAPTSTPPVRQYTPPTPAAPPLSAPPRSASPGLDPCCRLTISKRVVHWIGPVALILLCVLSFFTWLAASPGGYPVYTQSAWSVAGGVFSPDITGEKVMNRETDLEPLRTIGWSMVLALLLSVTAALIGVGVLLEKYTKVTVPDIISHIWPRRIQYLTVASVVILLLLSLQLVFGMGLESYTSAMAEKRFPAPSETETSEQKTIREVKRGEEISRLGIRRTGWLWLAYLASVAAAAGFALELALERRGDQPDPTIDLMW